MSRLSSWLLIVVLAPAALDRIEPAALNPARQAPRFAAHGRFLPVSWGYRAQVVEALRRARGPVTPVPRPAPTRTSPAWQETLRDCRALAAAPPDPLHELMSFQE